MIVGFTGTREGMTFAQSEAVLSVLRGLSPSEVHHGCCVGADAEVHNLAYWDWPLHGHPGPAGAMRADLGGFKILYPPKDYGQRNQDIIDACVFLVAAPQSHSEHWRSGGGGTWQTIRRAKKAGKRIAIVWPDGSVTS